MNILERADKFAEGKANEAITKAIAQAFVEGYKAGYHDRECDEIRDAAHVRGAFQEYGVHRYVRLQLRCIYQAHHACAGGRRHVRGARDGEHHREACQRHRRRYGVLHVFGNDVSGYCVPGDEHAYV